MNIRDNASRLAELPWQFLVLQTHRFAMKCLVSYSSYDILVTDSVSMWRETLNGELIISRNNNLNPNIETSPSRLLHHLEDILGKRDKESTLVVEICNENELKIISQSSMSGYGFRWEFHLKPVASTTFAEQLTKPLIVMVAELSRRQQELINIIQNKDAQIDDYKAEGVRLSRRHNDDKPFEKSQFLNEMAQAKEFVDLVAHPEDVTFSSNMQEMYKEIAKQIFKTSANPIKQDNETGTVPECECEEDKESPAKEITPALPASDKDLEMERRNMLKLKLEEDKLKKENKKKKRKLNL